MNVSAFTKGQMIARPTETRLMKLLYKAVNPTIVDYMDGTVEHVYSIDGFMDEAFNLDEFYAMTNSGSWVHVVMGESW